jgi:hypothetical protein
MLKGNHSKLLVAWRPCPEHKAQQRPSTSSVICLTETNKLKLSIKNSVLSTTCDRPETPILQSEQQPPHVTSKETPVREYLRSTSNTQEKWPLPSKQAV